MADRYDPQSLRTVRVLQRKHPQGHNGRSFGASHIWQLLGHFSSHKQAELLKRNESHQNVGLKARVDKIATAN